MGGLLRDNDLLALTYTSEPLATDTTVTGHVDLHVLLEEVDSDGTSHYITEGSCEPRTVRWRTRRGTTSACLSRTVPTTTRLCCIFLGLSLLLARAMRSLWLARRSERWRAETALDALEKRLLSDRPVPPHGAGTALVIYNAGQETPQELSALVERGYVAPIAAADAAAIEQGRATFESIGCASCHVPEMRLNNTVFEEPTLRGNGNYYNTRLAAAGIGYDPERPARFDVLEAGDEPRLQGDSGGGATVRLYGDLKRHAMGRHLADRGGPTAPVTAIAAPVEHNGEPIVVAPDTFLTPELWGVGNTGPWLHDGRAGSLEEAVLLHGEDEPPAGGEAGRSEAQESRDAYVALPAAEQESLVKFLRSLRTFVPRR